ncbi:unnamed protein product, partial [Allacma fusca]
MAPANFNHVVLNNGAHDSVGGQPTAASEADLSITSVAQSVGYKNTWIATSTEQVHAAVKEMSGLPGPNLLEIKISRGSRKNLGRPTRTPVQNKIDFMHFLAINGS